MLTITEDDFRESIKQQVEKHGFASFKCPRCATVQSKKDFVSAGVADEDIEKYLGFSCIGRLNKKATGCDWTLGGLFKIHKIEIALNDGDNLPFFELATDEEVNSYKAAIC